MNTPLYLRAPLDLKPTDEQAAHFSGIAYSGGVISEFGEQLIIDLEQTSVETSMPLLLEHDRREVIGVVESAKKGDRGIEISGTLFADIDESAKTIAAKAGRGAKYQMSVGLFGARIEEVPAGSKPVTVNGQQHKGPLLLLRGGTVRETSVVTLGADPATNADFFRAGERRPNLNEDPTMPDAAELQAQVQALESRVNDLTSERDAAIERADKAEQAVKDAKLSARKRDVQALFAELGREYSDEKAAHYLALGDEAFAVIAKDMRESKPRAPEHLFSEQAVGNPGASGKSGAALSYGDIYAARRAS